MGVALVGFLGAAVGGLTTAAGGLTTIGSLLAAGINIGLGLAINALFAPKGPKPVETKTPVQETTPVRSVHLGRVRIAGKMIAIEAAKDGGYCYIVLYLGEGPIDGIEEHYLDNRLVGLDDIDADGWVRIPPFGRPLTHSDPMSRIQIKTRLGTEDQTHFQEMEDAIGSANWNEDFRGRGCALVYLGCTSTSAKKSNFMKVYPNRYTQYNCVKRGRPILDPRTNVWAFSENLVLMLAHYLTSEDGAQIDAAYLDWDDFAAGATHADDILTTKGGGTVRRYWGSFSWDLDSNPGDNIDRLLTATQGRLILKPNGLIGYMPGEWIAPTFSMPAGKHSYCELQNFSPPERDYNEVIVKYTNPNSRYNAATAQAWRDEADVSASGSRRPLTIEAFEINNHNHARRVAKRVLATCRPAWQGPIRGSLVLMQAWDQRNMLENLDDIGLVEHSMEIEDIQIDDDAMEVSANLISMDADAWAFNAELEEGTAPVDPDDLGDEATEKPLNVEFHFEQRRLSSDQSVAVLVGSWDQPDGDGPGSRKLTAEAQYSVADENRWIAMAVDDDETGAESPPLAERDAAGALLLYDGRVRWDKSDGELGDWVTVENVPAIANATPPPTPVEPEATRDGTSVRASARAAEDVQEAQTWQLEARRSQPNTSALAATVVNIQSARANDTREFVDAPGPGVWRYRWFALNPSGVRSLASVEAAPDVVMPGETFADNFDRADGPLADPWERTAGGAAVTQVSGNELLLSGPSGTADSYLYVNPKYGVNHYGEATLKNSNASIPHFFALRGSGANNMAGFRYITGSGWQAYKKVGGTYTQLGSAVAGSHAVGDVVRWWAVGTNIYLSINGVMVFNGQALGSGLTSSGSDLATNVSIGFLIRLGAGLDLRLDDFKAGIV